MREYLVKMEGCFLEMGNEPQKIIGQQLLSPPVFVCNLVYTLDVSTMQKAAE